MSWQRGYGEAIIGSDARPVRRGEMLAVSQGEMADLLDRATRRGFRRGVAVVCLAALALAGGIAAASAETVKIGREFVAGKPAIPSSVTISPSSVPGELAQVTFDNRHVNQEPDNGSHELATQDVAVSVRFTFDFNPLTGADRIDVAAPAGVTCAPADCGVTVMEGFTGTVILFQWEGM